MNGIKCKTPKVKLNVLHWQELATPRNLTIKQCLPYHITYCYILKSFCMCLRRITEPLRRLTFWDLGGIWWLLKIRFPHSFKACNGHFLLDLSTTGSTNVMELSSSGSVVDYWPPMACTQTHIRPPSRVSTLGLPDQVWYPPVVPGDRLEPADRLAVQGQLRPVLFPGVHAWELWWVSPADHSTLQLAWIAKGMTGFTTHFIHFGEIF